MNGPAGTSAPILITRAGLGRSRRLNRLARRLYWVLAGAAVLLSAAPSAPRELPLVLGGAAVLGYLTLWAASLVARAHDTRYGDARVEGDVLHLVGDGFAYALPASSLREGYLRFGPLGWSVRVTDLEGVMYEAGVPDPATGHRWLDALGLDASRRAVRVVSNRAVVQWAFAYFFGGFFAMPFWLIAMALLALLGTDLISPAGGGLVYLFTLPGYWWAARSVGRVDIAVGADGVRAGRGFRRVFFPVHRIEGAALEGAVLLLRLVDGVRRYRFDRAEDAMAVAARIAEVVALYRASPQWIPAAIASAQATTPEAWREVFLHALRDEGYRAQAFTQDDLSRLVGAKDVPAAQRLGAALALRELAPEQGVTGVRIAVDAMVDPALPRALEHAAADARARQASGAG